MKRRHAGLYRSGLEKKIAKDLSKVKNISFEYEPSDKKIAYTIPANEHTYTPDFVIVTASGKIIYIETKGIWDYDDRYKHLLIRQQHPDKDIRFVFTRSQSRIRKKSRTTYADICNGLGRAEFKGVKWQYADRDIPEEWLQE